MGFELTPEQESLKSRVAAFCAKECSPEFEAELDKTGSFPERFYQKMASAGFFGVPYAKEYGGSGGSMFETILLIEELAASSHTAATMFMVPVIFGGMVLQKAGSAAQRQSYLPPLIRGQMRFAFALTEPEAGSDAAAIKTTASRSGDAFCLNGAKRWATGAAVADYIVVVARTAPKKSVETGTSLFLVPREAKGIEIRPIPKLAGGAFASCEVHLRDVSVPAENIVGGLSALDRGWQQLMATADLERLCVAASCVGSGRAILKASREYAESRKQFGRPVFEFQAIQHALAEMATDLEAMRWMTYHAAWMKARGKRCFREAAMAKLFCSEKNVALAKRGMQILGGNGYSMEFSMQRLLRESYLTLYAAGTSEIQKNIIARLLR